MLDKPNDQWYKKIGLLFLEVLIYGVIVFVILGFIFGFFSVVGVDVESAEMEMNKPLSSLLVLFVPQMLALTFAMYVCNNLIFKRPWNVTGFVKKGWLKDTSDGYLLAFLLIGAGFLILRLLGFLSFEDIDFQPYYFFAFFAMFIVQSASEEVLARSWMMSAVESRFGPWVALILTSGVFCIMHFSNPNGNWVGLLNIFLAGMMLGLFFLKYRNIWFITGLHAGWNWVQATVFDFNVSGYDVYSMINFNPYGNEMISGGAFGFEGSIVSSLLQLVVIGYLLFKNYNEMFGNRPVFHVQLESVDEISETE